jgi:hypothetical protein
MLPEKEAVIRQEFAQKQRDSPQVPRAVVDANGDERPTAGEDGLGAEQGFTLRAFPIQLEESHPHFGKHRIERPPGNALPQLRRVGVVGLRITASFQGPGLLETFRMYFPGYQAKVDGRPAPVIPSLNRMVAVSLPAGTHSVELYHRPRWPLGVAAAVSLTTLAGLAFGMIRSRRKNRA